MAVLQFCLRSVDVSCASQGYFTNCCGTDQITVFRYSTMDNVDGKQARRTGQSSGLGELFE